MPCTARGSAELTLNYASKLLMVAWCSALPVAHAQQQNLNCTTQGSLVCSNSEGQTLTSPVMLIDGNGSYPLDVTNNATLQMSPGSDAIGVEIISQGPNGTDDDFNGESSFDTTLTNNGSVSLTLTGAATEMGIGVRAASRGGVGYTPDHDDDGGPGGNSGQAILTNNAAVTMSQGANGNYSAGILGVYAETAGGNGGAAHHHAIDHYGGNGGTAGTVTLNNNAAVALGASGARLTGGVRAWGVAAESVGGEGGLFAKGQETGSIGGEGGSASGVTLNNLGNVQLYWNNPSSETTSEGVVGVIARSIGGVGGESEYTYDSGGNGGNAGSVQINVGPAQGAANPVHTSVVVDSAQAPSGTSAGVFGISRGGAGGEQSTHGGSGGQGGNAGSVTIQLNNTSVQSTGDNVAGVIAFSRGADGGAGDNSDDSTDGGNGGKAGNVSVSLDYAGSPPALASSVTTQGSYAYGMLAQSVGGFGGAGTAQGGIGQDAGTAFATTLTYSSVKTVGDYAAGIVTQSIGGGGGIGTDFTDGLAGAGGNGGNGGSGTNSTISTSGTISTNGLHAYGLLAQSIGGSGGTGGVGEGLILALGGDGGAGGSGGTVSVDNAGTVLTNGYASTGMAGQSIGGGGGAAGSATGLFAIGGSVFDSQDNGGGTVTLTNTGVVVTQGDAAIGLLGQSIGGGGGSAASAAGLLSVGGSAGSGGDGGAVTVNANGTQNTSGNYAYGVVAQSIGGGGGNGGDAFALTTALPTPAIGGSGGDGGDGGTVVANVNNSGTVVTQGAGATGLLAQSIGGGGGTGGSATNVALLDLISLAIGGSAGDGGNAGTVTVQTSEASLQTNGAAAAGIVAQSIGGGGGSGGAAQTAGVNLGVSVGVAVGGSGGGGGNADQVSVTLDDTQINTAGLLPGQAPSNPADSQVDQTDSYGVLAQSIGGGGGAGGSATARSVALPVGDGETFFAIGSAVSVGGSGGDGGSGKEVDVTLSGNSLVRTNAQGSHGVLAQSIGGGGGSGGDSKAMSRTFTVPDVSIAVNVDVSVGGGGGVSGDAGLVDLALDDQAQIATHGDYSNALMGQSIGGGGGNAGIGSSGSGGLSKGTAYTVDVGVGAKGSAGGAGGQAQATLAQGTALTTFGSGSRGVLLQSIGGGGGASQGATVDVGAPLSTGGGGGEATTSLTASVSVSVGEDGGAGGAGDTVTLTDAGTIKTSGDDADGILLQSIGGGGGLGGSAGSDASAGPTSYPDYDPDEPGDDPPSDDTDLGSYSLSIGVGGKGGGGGNGGKVTVNYTGNTTTQGDLADAMVVQSIGGGGGVGGTSTAKGAKGDAGLSIAVGGQGGDGGDGGEIDLNMSGTANSAGTQAATGQLTTHGNVAYGLLAQSIGGGGGQAADGSADVTYKTIDTPSLLIGVGGKGGAGGKGGTINMNSSGSLIGASTQGTGSHAIVLQSIGGGGGAASAGASNSASLEGDGFVLNLGGGGAGADSGGGTINVDSVVLATTNGHGAYGLVAQSIGGGGGIAYAGQAANVSSATIDSSQQGNSYDASGADINMTLNAVAGSQGGNSTPSSISTTGSAAHGIVLQSIGGGGGIAGDPGFPLKMGWQGGGQANSQTAHADGGDITLDVGSSEIMVNGDNSYGVIMQSIADGGGLGGTSQGSFAGSLYDHSQGGGSKAGSITFTQSGGAIWTYGSNAVGVFAQSDGNTSQASPISLTINGWVQQMNWDPTAIGLWLDGGTTSNSVTVGGLLVANLAVQQTGQGITTATVSGTGAISGSLDLGKPNGDNVGVVNNAGTLLNAKFIKGTVFNNGSVLIGSQASIDTMQVTHDFNQREAGVLHVSTDFSGRRADLLTVDGAARLGGRVQIDAMTLMPDRELAFLQAGSLAPEASVGGASPLFDFNTRYTDRSASVSVGQAHFGALSDTYGVGANLRAVGDHLQDIWDRGSNEALGALYAQLDQAAGGGASRYSSALSDLSPGVSAAPAALATGAAKGFADTLFSCPWFNGASAQTAEGDCVWGRIADKTTHLDAGRGTSATRARSTAYQLGTQRRIAPNWVAGLSAAYENSTIRSDDSRMHTEGDTGYLGAVLKYEAGPWTFSGATYGSFGDYDNKRRIELTGAQAKSDSTVWAIGQQLRASYTYATDKAYIKPYANLDLIYTRMPSYSEHGAGALDLEVDSADKLTALLTPGVEVGGRFDLKNGFIARPFANVGVSVASTDSWDTRAQLAAAPAGSRNFTTTLQTGRVFGHASVGVELASRRGFDVRLQYDGVISDRTRSSAGSVKATWRF